LVFILCALNSLIDFLVSSAAHISTLLSISIALFVISFKLPMGVATIYKVPDLLSITKNEKFINRDHIIILI